MIGRKVSKWDIEILNHLQQHYHNSVKIDFDIINEPCIFFNYYGSWNVVYKLSKDGTYTQKRWHYVLQAHEAIQNFIIEEEKNKKFDEIKHQEAFLKQREKNKKQGLKDDLPSE